MKYYIESQTNELYAYEDDCPLIYIKEELAPLTEEEYQAIITERNTPKFDDLLAQMKVQNARLRDVELDTIREYKTIEDVEYTLKAKRDDIGLLTAFIVACQAGIQTSLVWYFSSNNYLGLDLTGAITLAQWIQSRISLAYTKEAEINVTLDACPSVTELQAIDLSSLWTA